MRVKKVFYLTFVTKLTIGIYGVQMLVLVIVIVYPFNINAQIYTDSSIVFLSNFTIENIPKQLYKNPNDSSGFNCVYFSNQREDARLRYLFKNDSLKLDTIIINTKEFIIDLKAKNYNGLLTFVVSRKLHDNAPIKKIKIIKAVVLNKDSLFKIKKDSLLNELKFLNKTTGSLQSNFQSNPNSYLGYESQSNYLINSQIRLNQTFAGIPLIVSTGISNQRDPINYNWRDVQISFDYNKYEKQKFLLNRLNNVNKENINSIIEAENLKLIEIDTSIYFAQLQLDDPGKQEILLRKKRILLELNALDSNTLLPEQKQLKYNTKVFLDEQDSVLKFVNNAQLEKRKLQNKISRLNSEKKKLQLWRGASEKKTIPGLPRLVMPRLNRFNLGKVFPVFSDLAINSLVINGIDLELETHGNYANLFGGSNLEQLDIQNNRVLGAKIGSRNPTSDKYITAISVYNNALSKNNQTYIIGFGFNEQINKSLIFKYELMYCESDSSLGIEQKLNRNYFQSFELHKIASKLSLEFNSPKGFSINGGISYFGLQYFNPAINLNRTDLLRINTKTNWNLFKNKLKINLHYSYDHDNLSGLKQSGTKLNTIGLNPQIRLTKHSKLSFNYLFNHVNTILQESLSPINIEFSSRNLSAIWLFNKVNKKKTINQNIQLNFMEFVSSYFGKVSKSSSVQANYLLSLIPSGYSIQNSFFYQSNSDSLSNYQISITALKVIKNIQIGLEFKEIKGLDQFYNRGFCFQFNAGKNRFLYSTKLEAFQDQRYKFIYELDKLRISANLQILF